MNAGRGWVALGAMLAALAVVIGAFAAHGLESQVEPRGLENIKTGAHYQLTHALGLIAVGLVAGMCRIQPPSPTGITLDGATMPPGSPTASSGGILAAGLLLTLGIVFFSGALYALELSPLVVGTRLRWFGAIAPIGGTAMILGWVTLAIAACRRP